MRKIFSLILIIAMISAMFVATAQAAGTATVTLSSTYAQNGQYEVTATIQGGTFTNGDVVLNIGTNVTLKSLTSTLDPTAEYNVSNGVLTFIFATEAVDATQAKELFKATFEIAAGVDASEIAVPTFGTNDDGNTTTIQYLADEASTPVDFDVTLNTEGFDLIKPAYILGDVNNSGAVDILDCERLFEHVMETNFLEGVFLQAADVNGSGAVDILDCERLFEHVMETNPLQ